MGTTIPGRDGWMGALSRCLLQSFRYFDSRRIGQVSSVSSGPGTACRKQVTRPPFRRGGICGRACQNGSHGLFPLNEEGTIVVNKLGGGAVNIFG